MFAVQIRNMIIVGKGRPGRAVVSKNHPRNVVLLPIHLSSSAFLKEARGRFVFVLAVISTFRTVTT